MKLLYPIFVICLILNGCGLPPYLQLANQASDARDIEDYELAIELYTQSLAESEDVDDARYLASIYLLRGLSKAELKDYDGAISDYETGISIYPIEELKDIEWIGGNYGSIGIALNNKGELAKSLVAFQKGYDLDPEGKYSEQFLTEVKMELDPQFKNKISVETVRPVSVELWMYKLMEIRKLSPVGSNLNTFAATLKLNSEAMKAGREAVFKYYEDKGKDVKSNFDFSTYLKLNPTGNLPVETIMERLMLYYTRNILIDAGKIIPSEVENFVFDTDDEDIEIFSGFSQASIEESWKNLKIVTDEYNMPDPGSLNFPELQ